MMTTLKATKKNMELAIKIIKSEQLEETQIQESNGTIRLYFIDEEEKEMFDDVYQMVK